MPPHDENTVWLPPAKFFTTWLKERENKTKKHSWRAHRCPVTAAVGWAAAGAGEPRAGESVFPAGDWVLKGMWARL